jgi:hypothetical protein
LVSRILDMLFPLSADCAARGFGWSCVVRCIPRWVQLLSQRCHARLVVLVNGIEAVLSLVRRVSGVKVAVVTVRATPLR